MPTTLHISSLNELSDDKLAAVLRVLEVPAQQQATRSALASEILAYYCAAPNNLGREDADQENNCPIEERPNLRDEEQTNVCEDGATSPIVAAPEILIVEDSRLQAKVLQNMLGARGYRARIASDGAQGLAMARERRPDLILSDIVMPIMDGYAMCAQLKSDESLREVPVVLLTALSDIEDVVLGLEARADFYLTKPYDQEFLLSMVRDALRVAPSYSFEYSKDKDEAPLVFYIGGQKRVIHSDRRQILNLLLSTYGNAIEQNRALVRAQNELQRLNDELHERTRQIAEQQSELEQINAYLQTIATHDGLTTLKNHTAFKNQLSLEVEHASHISQPLSLLLMDVDFFKQFNDTFGHPAGDEVLRRVAHLIKRECREADFTARYGGEEFAMLLPQTPHELALVLAERLRMAIENEVWPLRNITVSVGAATFRDTYSTPDTEFALLEAADQALYCSKRAGRNCTTHSADINNETSED